MPTILSVPVGRGQKLKVSVPDPIADGGIRLARVKAFKNGALVPSALCLRVTINQPLHNQLSSANKPEVGLYKGNLAVEANIESLDKMLAAWNSNDANEIEQLAKEALEHNVHFADPSHNIIGREAFVAMVLRTHERVPGAIYSRASRIDQQNNFCRYHWAIHLNDNLLLEGFDVTEINDTGKVVKVLGFFGPLNNELTAIA